MSHQPFENWLFSDETIDPEDSEALEEHLKQCEQCLELSTALDQVFETISTAKTPEPSPGFTQRWYQNLAVYREKQQERRIWFFILGLFTLACFILLGLFFINLSNFNGSYVLAQFAANVSLFATRLNNLLKFAKSITRAFPILIPGGC
ncbi:MAG: zf-HC2 domain-containing protein [Brevefilum sp.]|nr:zf-HC2 domain-containing protein [Brevefilum sp.]